MIMMVFIINEKIKEFVFVGDESIEADGWFVAVIIIIIFAVAFNAIPTCGNSQFRKCSLPIHRPQWDRIPLHQRSFLQQRD